MKDFVERKVNFLRKKKENKLKILDGNFSSISEIEKFSINLLREIDAWEKYQECVAKIMRARYLQLKKEGFSEDQAIRLCQTNNILG